MKRILILGGVILFAVVAYQFQVGRAQAQQARAETADQVKSANEAIERSKVLRECFTEAAKRGEARKPGAC